VAERRVAAVGGAEDGVVDLVPAGVGEDGREGGCWARGLVSRGGGGDFEAVLVVADYLTAFR